MIDDVLDFHEGTGKPKWADLHAGLATAPVLLARESFPELDRLLAIFDDVPTLKVEIAGHTDSDGSDAYNEILSEKRAQSTLNWLVDQGIELKFYLDRFRFIFDKGFNILECLHLIAFTNFDGIGSMFEDRRFETRAFDTDGVFAVACLGDALVECEVARAGRHVIERELVLCQGWHNADQHGLTGEKQYQRQHGRLGGKGGKKH